MDRTRYKKERDHIKDMSLELGKMPPQAIEMEEAVLGALMLDKESYFEIQDILSADHFYKDSNQKIFSVIAEMGNKKEPIDILTVVEALRKKGNLEKVGGPYYISQLTNKVATTAHIEIHAKIVAEKYIKRELIRVASSITHRAFDESEDFMDLVNFSEKAILAVNDSLSSNEPRHIRETIRETHKNILEAKANKERGKQKGISTPLHRLNEITQGWQDTDLILLAARPSMGKCLKRGTELVMYDGTIKKVEDVRVGDQLMGDDSTPRNVLSLARGREMMYNIHQCKAQSYCVNESHILSLKQAKTEKINGYSRGDVIDIELTEFMKKSWKYRNKHFKGYKVGYELPEKPTTLEPYFLGLWLGDGSASKQVVHSPDIEIEEYLRDYAKRLGGELTDHSGKHTCPAWAIVRTDKLVIHELRDLNLLDNKHIPENYLLNSTEKRLELLAGLLDTDGCLSGAGSYEITQKSKTLIDQIKQLCDSLGFHTNVSESQKSIKKLGFTGTYYRMHFSGDVHKIPCKVKRKISPKWETNINCLLSTLTIEKDKVDDYYGFELDGNRRYLLKDGTVTHNTAVALNVASVASNQVPVGIFSLEMNTDQLNTRLISSRSDYSPTELRGGIFEDVENVNEAVGIMAESNIIIDDSSNIHINELCAKARRMKKKHNIGLLIIDYLQLITAGKQYVNNREAEVSLISRTLKGLAKELHIPIIALAQLNRGLENRTDKKPRMSDLRESGSLEQDADMIIFVHRPIYYKEHTITVNHNGSDLVVGTDGLGMLVITKHRNGMLDDVLFKHNIGITQMWDYKFDELDI